MSQKDIPAPEQGAVRDSNHFQRLIRTFSEKDDAVMITDINGVIEYVNPPFESMTGYRQEEALGKSAGLVKSNLHGASFYAGMWDALRAGKEFRALFVNRRKNGEIFHEEKTIRPFVDANGTPTHYISTGRDVSERVQMLLTLEHQAYYDSLTGLPNRQLFMDRLGQAIAHATRHGRNFTLLCVDLDEFKSINDTFGHAVGDDLLRTAAVRMKQCLREEDTADKVLILMTDGQFNTYYDWDWVYNRRLGRWEYVWTEISGSSVSEQRARTLCDNMKSTSRDIVIYSVAFKAPTSAKNLLKYCATNATTHYFDAENGAELRTAFRIIANDVNRLRLTE